MKPFRTFPILWTVTILAVATATAQLPIIFKCTDSPLTNLTIPQEWASERQIGNASVLTFALLPKKDSSCAERRINVTLGVKSSSVADPAEAQFTPEGYVRWKHNDNNSIIYSSPDAYCVSEYDGSQLVLQVCMHPCLAGQQPDVACAPKCCRNGMSLRAAEHGGYQCGTAVSTGVWRVGENLTQFTIIEPKSEWTCEGNESLVRADKMLGNLNAESQCVDFSEDHPGDVAVFTCHSQNGRMELLNHTHAPGFQGPAYAVQSNIAKNLTSDSSESAIMADVSPPDSDTTLAVANSTPPYQEFMYKCGPEVAADYWVAPNHFRIAYGDEKLNRFEQDLNYFPMFNFTLRERRLDCSETFVLRSSMGAHSYNAGPNVTTMNFTPDGYLTYIYDTGELLDEIYFHKDQFCIVNISDAALTVKACKSTCYHREEEKGPQLCIPKCCPFGWIWILGECQEIKDDWIPPVYANRLASKPLLSWNGVMKYVPPEFACFNDSRDGGVFSSKETKFLTNGKLVRHMNKSWHPRLSWKEHAAVGGEPFCMDAYWSPGISPTLQLSEAKVIVVTCLQKEDSQAMANKSKELFYTHQRHSQIIVPVIFFPCILVYTGILIIYLMLWDKQSAHGWTVMAFSASQLVLYLVLMITVGMAIYSNSLLLQRSMQYVCNTLGIIHNFAFISTYSWTAVLTFDVWAKLSSMAQSSKNSKGKKRFFYYSCFGVGIPTFVVAIASMMEWAFWEFSEDAVVMPGYSDYCVVTGRKAFLFYQGLPSAILFGGNLVFLFLTFRSLWDTKKKVDILKGSGSSKSKQSSFDNKMILVGKLMLMMGAFLIFEFIFNFASLIEISIYFTFLEVYRILHAVGLFYLFVCSDKVKKQLGEKYPSLHRKTVARMGRNATVTETVFVSTVSEGGRKQCDVYAGGNQANRLTRLFTQKKR